MKFLKNAKWIMLGMAISITAMLVIPAVASVRQEQAELTFRGIRITLAGQEIIPTDVHGNVVEPFIIDGTTFLPVRGIANALGIEVDWHEPTSTVILIPPTPVPTPTPIPTPTPTPVLSVTINPATTMLQRGATQQFTAHINNSPIPSNEIAWTVVGANAVGTTITQAGMLIVAANETATTITVRATSVQSPVVFATATVSVGMWRMTATPDMPDFGSANFGYAFRPAQTVTIRNTGDQTITLDPLPQIPGWLLVPAANWTTPFAPNQVRTFTVRPNLGLQIGSHSPVITVTGTGGVTVDVFPWFVVLDGSWDITATPEFPDFGTHGVGYSQRPTQTITVRNTGDQVVTLDPLPYVSGWTLVPAANWHIQFGPNQVRTFTIRPSQNLPIGTHGDTIAITVNGGSGLTTVHPTFTVTESVSSISVTPVSPNFGTHSAGYSQRPTQTITITNNGTTTITMDALQPVANWTLIPAANWRTPMAPGYTRTFTIRPNNGLASGVHSPFFIVSANNGEVIDLMTPMFIVN